MGFDCISRTHIGLRRKLNEDAVLNCPEQLIWAVADGMGGHDAGEVASSEIVNALAAMTPSANLEKFVERTVARLERVNSALVDMGRAGFELRTIGSTVVGLVIAQGRYACFWAGDSRAYRLREGAILQISRDHSLVQDLVEAGVLDAADAESHPSANVVTRAVGASESLKVDTVTGELKQGDIFLLASDGLTRLVSDEELLAKLSTPDLEQTGDHLIRLGLERGAPDNISFVIIRAG